MLRLLSYLINKGVVTAKSAPATLAETCNGLPTVTDVDCADECNICVSACPTSAIVIADDAVALDRGSCIGCNLCVEICPTGTLAKDRSTAVWSYDRAGLLVSKKPIAAETAAQAKGGAFSRSLAVRVISTGCSACDLEVAAAGNPIFDMERFGVSVVASPRAADALLITGPVPKALHDAVLSTYAAMSSPKIVIACGTCAISGGLHGNGYAEANGVFDLLPVDVFIPGCPPHPWQIILGIAAAKRLQGRTQGEVKSKIALPKLEKIMAKGNAVEIPLDRA